MQRDMGLVRQILFKMEDHSGGFAPPDLSISGYSEDQVAYHVWLLGQAGLLTVEVVTTYGSSAPQAIPINLTWAGHDFLDAARNDTIWSKAMDRAKTVGGTLSFEILKKVLDSILKGQLGL